MMHCKVCDIPVVKHGDAWFHVNGDPNTETIAREVYNKDE